MYFQEDRGNLVSDRKIRRASASSKKKKSVQNQVIQQNWGLTNGISGIPACENRRANVRGRVLHMPRAARYIGTRESRATAPGPSVRLIARSSWNRSFLAHRHRHRARTRAAAVYRTGGSGLLQRLHSPGHSLLTECPSRRVCHCFPCRFLTVYFLGRRETARALRRVRSLSTIELEFVIIRGTNERESSVISVSLPSFYALNLYVHRSECVLLHLFLHMYIVIYVKMCKCVLLNLFLYTYIVMKLLSARHCSVLRNF